MVGAAVGCSASISGCYVRPPELLWTCFDPVRQLHDCCVGNKFADRSPDCSPSYRHLSPRASGIPRCFAKPLHFSWSAGVELYLHLPLWHSGGQLHFSLYMIVVWRRNVDIRIEWLSSHWHVYPKCKMLMNFQLNESYGVGTFIDC